MTELAPHTVLNLSRDDVRWVGPEDEAGYLWAVQDGRIFGWSESNMRYELAWWLNPDGTPKDIPNKGHLKALLAERPFDPAWLTEGDE